MAEEDTDKTAQAAKIIRKHMLGSLASGILPLPIVDMAILTAIQTRMAGQLAKLHDVEFSEQHARAIIGSLAGLSLAVTAGNTLGLLLPGIGKALRGIGMFTVPPATTYALGQVFNKHFESGGTVRASAARNCRPCSRSLSHPPWASSHSPGCTAGRWQSTVVSSRRPASATRRMARR